MFRLNVLTAFFSKSAGAFEVMSLRLPKRLPLSLLTFGYNLNYLSFNLQLLGFYLEREVCVTDWEGNYKMKWSFFWMGLRKCTLDYLRGGKETDA